MSTPERQQDPGETGYGGTAQDDRHVDEPIELPAFPLDESADDESQEAPPEQQPEPEYESIRRTGGESGETRPSEPDEPEYESIRSTGGESDEAASEDKDAGRPDQSADAV